MSDVISLELRIRVKYELLGGDIDDLVQCLNNAAEHLVDNGLLTPFDHPAEVEEVTHEVI